MDLLNPDGDTSPLIDFIKRKEDHLGVRCVKVTQDTLARAMPGGNENSSEDMGRVVANGDRIRHAIGCAIELVHHAGKDSLRGARGHSSLKAATDTEIEVTNGDGLHTVRPTKQRDYPLGDEFFFRLRQVEIGLDQAGDPGMTCIPEVAEGIARQSTSRPKLWDKQAIAYKALLAVLDQSKQLPPWELMAIEGGPRPGQFISRGDQGQVAAMARGISEADQKKDQARVFRKIRHALQAKGLIESYDNYVWLADQGDQ